MGLTKDISGQVCKIVEQKLEDNGYTILSKQEIDYGIQIRTLAGCIINIYNSGKILLQGTKDENLKLLLR